MAAVDVVVAPGRSARSRTRRRRGAPPAARSPKSSRGASVGGPKSRGVIAVAHDVGDAVERLGQRRDDARALRARRSRRWPSRSPPRAAARRPSAAPPAPGRRSPSPSSPAPPRRRCRRGWCRRGRSGSGRRVIGATAKIATFILQRAAAAGPPPRAQPASKAIPPMSQALHPMLNIAIKAARAAGAIINRASLDLDRLQVSTKAPNDFVTEVDHAAEAAIIDTLLAAYPGHGILAEESGRDARRASDSEYVWIIDPLDGTTNFIHGLPIYAVSIAPGVSRPDPAGGRLRPGAQRPVLRHQGPRRLPERQAAARLQAHAHGRRADRHRLPVPQGRQPQALPEDARGGDEELRRPAPPRRRRARPLLRRRRLVRRLLRDRPVALGRRRRLADRHRGRRPGRQLHRRGRLPAPARGRRRQPEDLRPAGADARAATAASRRPGDGATAGS